MNRFSRVILCVLTLYFAFVVGVHFHSHATESESGKLQCNLCQVSQMSVDLTANLQLASEPVDFGIYQAPQVPCPVECFFAPRLGRAPPQA